MNKWLRVMLLVAIALALPFVAFERRAEQAHCEFDVCTPDWSKGLLLPDHVVAIVKSNGRVMEEADVPAKTVFREAYLGVYVRKGVPFILGYLLGLVLPLSLLWYAVVHILRASRLTKPLDATT